MARQASNNGTSKGFEARDEVGVFQTVRAALAKSASAAGVSSVKRNLAVQQIVSRAVVSTQIVDILEAAGMGTPDISFYDALAQNQSAVEVMDDAHLHVIAHGLLSSLKSNASVDCQHRESARARMRIQVKRILRKHGYPPDLRDAAVQTVLQQAEVLSARWAA